MDVTGLENNYYLSGNDIWIKVYIFAKPLLRLELKVTNLNTGKTLPIFKLYADPANAVIFNASQTIRPLQPYPNHVNYNTLQKYKIEFTAILDDNTTEALSLERYFIRGGRDKNNIDEWYLQNNEKLFISKWVEWQGIDLPGEANKILNQYVVDFVPDIQDRYLMHIADKCKVKIIKFLNSKGGYQFWIFEASEIKAKSKAKSTVARVPMQLRADAYLGVGVDTSKELKLKSKVPAILQPIILDLLDSPDVLLYDPLGNDYLSKWHRLQLSGSNDALLNSNDMSYTNEITYSLPKYTNRDL